MKLVSIILCLVLLSVAEKPKLHFGAHEDIDANFAELFSAWTTYYNKVYDRQEYPLRVRNFRASIERINKLNSDATAHGVDTTFGLNKFSDLSPEEFAEKVLMKPFYPVSDNLKNGKVLEPTIDAPDVYDWRNQGKVTAVKDQGQCGSCWAFSVTENVESVWMIAKGLTNATMTTLAPQQIVDCDTSDAGCDGGDPPTAYQYIESAGGLESEKDYPYKAEDGQCVFQRSKVIASITDYKYATSGGDENLMKNNLVSWAPLSICVDARYWQDYQSGVMTAWQCDWIVQLDHCVQAVGFDTSASTPYWIVRNSWGTDWGEHGYILLEYGQNTCGLTNEATSAVA